MCDVDVGIDIGGGVTVGSGEGGRGKQIEVNT